MVGDQMKKFISALVAIALCVILLSCSSSQGTSIDDSYQEGLDQGYEDVFLNLWYASAPGVNILVSGESWKTEHFTLSITSGEDEWGSNIHIEMETHGLTMSECFDEQKMLFNVFSYTDGQWDGLLTDDLFYMYATLEEVTENTAKATVGIYDTTEQIAILVAVDGCIYKAVFPIIKIGESS
jgi:hypothetical protein